MLRCSPSRGPGSLVVSDEASVGANAVGTSLVVGTPVQVCAGEHDAEGHQSWTGAAAPVHDPATGTLLGALDLSGPAATVPPARSPSSTRSPGWPSTS